MGSYNYIGLENYHRLMKDQVFWTSLKNSLLLAIGFICIQHPLALIVAAVLDKLGGRGRFFPLRTLCPMLSPFRSGYRIPVEIYL